MKKYKCGIFIYSVCIGMLLMLNSCRNYDDIPELPPLAAIAEKSAETPAQKEKIENELMKLRNDDYPDYVIGPGDVISVQVYDNPELGVGMSSISPDGEISCMLLGPVNLGGKTIAQATKELETRYKEYLTFSRVSIQIHAVNSMYATISGKVNRPGRYPVNRNVRLSELYAMASGSPEDEVDMQMLELADFDSSMFIRNGEILPINFDKALTQGDLKHNIVVHANDYVYITTRANKVVSVLGEVNRPGFVFWYENMGLMEAVTRARGTRDEYWRQVLVIRGGFDNPQIYRVEYDEILAGRSVNPSLRPNDVIFVPKDGLSAYNVFIRKLLPTAQIINTVFSAISGYRDLQE